MKSIFSPSVVRGIQSLALKVAAMAGYDAARPTNTMQQRSPFLTNPNTSASQYERVRMQWNAEYLAKNSPLGIGYLGQRINYCRPLGWMPNIPEDRDLSRDVKAYLDESFKGLGINCSMQESFARISQVELPVRGDAALLWYRDEGRLRLIEVCADQIGELYTYANPNGTPEGMKYFAGMYFDAVSGIRRGYRFYDRGFDYTYNNPKNYPASDVIYFSDNLFRAIRGITFFHGTILSLTKSDNLFQYGMDQAQKQAKTGVVIRNNSGGITGLDYKREETECGTFVIERNGDGAVTQYQYIDDEYVLQRSVAPGQDLIDGCRYADEKSCLSLRMPYSFIVNAGKVGGASVRLEIVGRAGKEIDRIQNMICTPAMETIVYVLMMDAIDRKIFRGKALRYDLTKGSPKYPNPPSADAFRETKDDILSNRAGLDTRTRIMGRYNEDWHQYLEELSEEGIAIAKATQDSNRRLKRDISPIDGKPYLPTITTMDIAQATDNPQQAATAEEIERGELSPKDKSVTDNPSPARLSAYMGDFRISDLPESVKTAIKGHFPNAKDDNIISKFGMVSGELAGMADPHNMESAKKHIQYMSGVACSDEVHSNSEKHVIVNNGRVIDGHHYLSKAIKGKVSKSLPVIDVSPLRFQSQGD